MTEYKFGVGIVDDTAQYIVDELEKRGIYAKLLPITHFPKKRDLKNIDIIHGFYFFTAWPWFIRGKLARKKTICHWIGSDSLLALTNKKRRIQTKVVKPFIDKHLAVSIRIKEELAKLNFESEILHFGTKSDAEELPLPEKVGTLTYFIEGREQLYGIERTVKIAEKLPEVDFYFVGHFTPEKYKQKYLLPNVHFLGFVDMEKLWPKITVVLRLTEHDGYPRVFHEAFSKGRYAIHNYPLKGVIYCETDEEAIKEIKKLKEKTLNQEGIKLYKTEFSFEIFMDNLEKIYEKIVKK